MALYSGPGAAEIFCVAKIFRDECLLREGSLLDASKPVWTLRYLKELHKVFVLAPDEGDQTFIQKLEGQIRNAGADVIRLTAEVLCVYFLFPSNVGGARKRELVNEVLGWAGLELNTDHVVSVAFANGIGSGGQGYNTRRPNEIAFLIELAIAWNERLSVEERAVVAADRKRFQEFVDSIEDADSRQLRHMLLYLIFPNHFERIASRNHKLRILETFDGLVVSDDMDTDSAIKAVREELQKLLPGQELDFYRTPLREAWFDDGDGVSGETPLDVIKHKKQIVLYGPPGTGKTYRAKRLAGLVIRSAALNQMGAADYFKSSEAISDAIRKNVHRLQLHPAYSYEDFIRALHISKDGGTEYREGYLLRLIRHMDKQPRETRLPHVLILDEMNRTDLSRMLGECFSLLEDRKEHIELPGRDEDGAAMELCIPDDLFVIGTMNLIDQSIEQIDFALRRRFLWLLCPFDAEALLGAAKAKWEGTNSGLEWTRIESDFHSLAAAATALNREIHASPLLGAQYEIGHTYLLDVVDFLKKSLGPRPARKKNYLWNKKGIALEPLAQVWTLSIRPLLEQYLAGLDAETRNAELDRLSKVLLTSKASE